jgi:hypothetical protein
MTFHSLNVWAILVPAASAFVVGGLWYSPLLFGTAWKRANRFAGGEPPAPTAKVFAISFALTLVMAFNLAMFLHDPKTNLAWGATAGFLAGFGWVAMGIGVVSPQPFRLLLRYCGTAVAWHTIPIWCAECPRQ